MRALDGAINAFRFAQMSIVPQYAVSAMNGELLGSRGVRYDDVLPELSRRLALMGLTDEVLERFLIQLSGGMKQRTLMVISTLLSATGAS